MSPSQPALWLRGEGDILLIAATLLFGSWLVFAVAFFLPGLSMLGYMTGSRIGAIAYNIGLIWLAHIGFDRVLGYELKNPERFEETHLARF